MSGSCAPSSAHPPVIRLTNYRMFEYLLPRGDGRAVFRNHAVRFIVLDEVHTYKGGHGRGLAGVAERGSGMGPPCQSITVMSQTRCRRSYCTSAEFPL
jgi:hypothetical protein